MMWGVIHLPHMYFWFNLPNVGRVRHGFWHTFTDLPRCRDVHSAE
jgi:hypothetical protein